MKRWLEGLVAIAVVGFGLAVGMVWGRSPALVEWERARAVCIQSDDWGLCGFLPDSSAIVALDREALAPGPFPEVYWHSTLEDSAAVASLAGILATHHGRDGLPAVLQPNYILGSLEYASGPDSMATWIEHRLPDVPAGYERPGLWKAVRDARLAGVWHPELHGRWHYDPGRRKANTAGRDAVEAAASRQILVFPDSERSWELGPWRAREELRAELAGNLRIFADLFGREPRSVIAPDYVWNDADEAMWLAHDLRVIQGQRQQRMASWRGLEGRVRKVFHRTLTRWWRRDRVYLDRNCIFEPVQQIDSRGITTAAAAAVREAWARGEPAVLEAHRINFSHLDQRVPDLGRRELDRLLAGLDRDGAIFLVDGEVAGLQRRGTSWAARGTRIVLRNYTHSRRLVVLPAAARAVTARLRGQEPERAGPLVFSLAPGETRIVRGPI
ncbi:hypothetical protein GF314_11190 [bacterium]|nr:hypothetical protein [bacterium]